MPSHSFLGRSGTALRIYGVPGRSDTRLLRQPGAPHRDVRERRLGGRVLEEVVALVVDDDERREVLDLDLPDGLHAELLVLDDLDLLDAVLGEPGGGAADRAEVEAAVRVARLGDL